MKLKTLLTAGLLLFVAVCVGTLIVGEVQKASRPVVSPPEPAQPETPGATGGPADKVLVYCFHRTVRCDACQKLEAFTREALQAGFAAKVADGSIELRVVDYEQPPNEPFRQQFELIGASAVLVRVRGGRPADWDNLVDLDPLLEQREPFVRAVQQRLQAFLARENDQ
jgi:hypothetical protein